MNPIFRFLQTDMTVPTRWGWFHLLSLGLAAVALLPALLLPKKSAEKRLKVVLGVYAFPTFVLETLKQLSWSYSWSEESGACWDYQWYAAPFQLCTVPLFICLVCFFLPKNKLRTVLLSCVAFISLLASTAVAILPDSCFTTDILVNIHTMYLHCGSLAVAFYLLLSGEILPTFGNWRRGYAVFAGFAGAALLMDVLIYLSPLLLNAEGERETFNMFYISPYFPSTLPVLDGLWESLPYPVFLLCYFVAVAIGSLAVLGAAAGIAALAGKRKETARCN